MNSIINNLISIICPLYNKAQYVAETINSVLNQSSTRWELIIIDDGSTDDSYKIAQHYSNKYSNISLLKREDYKPIKGGSVCRNIGITLARGKYIMFLDADDILLPECISNRLCIAQNRLESGKDMYVFNEAYFYKDITMPFKKYSFFFHKFGYAFATNKQKFFLKKFLSYDLPWTISNILWNTNFLKHSVGGFNESYQRLQDPELHTKALINCNSSIVCYKYNTKPDVLIRLDNERHVAIKSKYGSLLSHIHSMKLFLHNYYVILNCKPYLRLLLVRYIFACEAMVEREKDNITLEEYIRLKAYINCTKKKYKFRYLKYDIFFNFFKYCLSSRILKKAKIGSIIYRLFYI